MSALSDEEEEDAPQRTNDLEQEFIFHYFTTVNRMKEVMKDARIEMKIDTFFRLLKRVTDTITILSTASRFPASRLWVCSRPVPWISTV